MKKLSLIITIFIISQTITAQDKKGTFWNPEVKSYDVKHAFEIESIAPIFLTKGYHFAIGYRYKKIRFRTSIIDGGTLDIEGSGNNNSSSEFKRYYKPGYGIFFGYNVWRNLEVYGYLENHTFEIEKVMTSEKKDINSFDKGIGISYQFFIGKRFYIQPGFHTYFRKDKSVIFDGGETYNIPTFDKTFVIRLGVRLFSKYDE